MKKEICILGAVGLLLTVAGPAAADGKAVYDKSCKGCHSAMKPKAGDKAAWAPLIARGADELTASVMKGKAPMPAKGGAASEADVKEAVEYMISLAK